MTAPTGAEILALINAGFPQQGTDGAALLKAIADAVSQGWTTWEKGLSFGSVKVTGAGAGAWTGTGQGGSISGPAYRLPQFSFAANDHDQVAMVDGLRQVMPSFMTKWSSTFKFVSLPYVGTSTATGSNPGTVTATNTPTPLQTAGKGTVPSHAPSRAKMADLWLAKLVPPQFDLTNPQGKTTELVNAITGAVEKAFDTIWLLKAKASNNQLSGAAANGGVVSGLASAPGGKIL